ncbi:MAG: histidine kinase, partial [Candidatus Eremiobacteraeota bacterium]|nr:histidine kinase [Candidatus Eremiobacteraeota bacterium]
MVTDGNGAAIRRWAVIGAIWLAIGLFDATQTIAVMRFEHMQHRWFSVLFVNVAAWLPWALATPFVLRIGRRWPLHVIACIAIDAVFSAWTVGLDILFDPYDETARAADFARTGLIHFQDSMLSSVVLYAGILTIRYALDSRERLSSQRIVTARLGERLVHAQLTALRRQIEPHFLFNTLNAISGLIREGRSEAAVVTIASLSGFLRSTLDDSRRHEVSLHDEMELVQRYLEIQQVRFADRLQLRVDVPPDLHPASVPSLILQPLVENAIKHGIAKRARGGEICISASKRDGMLALRVGNDGPNLRADWATASGGIGISNVRTRLESLYGTAFELSLLDRPTGGVEVVVELPLRVRATAA